MYPAKNSAPYCWQQQATGPSEQGREQRVERRRDRSFLHADHMRSASHDQEVDRRINAMPPMVTTQIASGNIHNDCAPQSVTTAVDRRRPRDLGTRGFQPAAKTVMTVAAIRVSLPVMRSLTGAPQASGYRPFIPPRRNRPCGCAKPLIEQSAAC